MVGITLIDAYLHGLSAKIMDQLVTFGIPDDLDRVITLTNRIDKRIQDREREGLVLLEQKPI